MSLIGTAGALWVSLTYEHTERYGIEEHSWNEGIGLVKLANNVP
jgi:hypothetical protein